MKEESVAVTERGCRLLMYDAIIRKQMNFVENRVELKSLLYFFSGRPIGKLTMQMQAVHLFVSSALSVTNSELFLVYSDRAVICLRACTLSQHRVKQKNIHVTNKNFYLARHKKQSLQ
jgi:hypothetical protein